MRILTKDCYDTEMKEKYHFTPSHHLIGYKNKEEKERSSSKTTANQYKPEYQGFYQDRIISEKVNPPL